MTIRLLVADDDPQILRALRIILSSKGYEVITAADGQEALDAAVSEHPDILIVDLGMPRLDGVALIEAVRGWSQAPILVISGRTTDAEKVRALDVGADDYVTKPFSVDELMARIRAMSRRLPQDSGAPSVHFGEVTVDLATRAVTRTVDGATRYIRLTPTEWKVLELLARNPGALVTRRTMLLHIWGSDHVTDTGYLRLYLSQLRRKLEPDPSAPRYLLTEPGMGYRLVTD
jgi:two-component system KDP operon response regulator KdpE